MRRQTLIGLLFVFALSGPAWAQLSPRIVWQKCHGGDADEQANCIIQTTDGGFAVVGSTSSNNNSGEVKGHHGGEDVWVLKLDATGDTEWEKCLGGTGTDYGYAIIQTTDGGYAVA